MTEATKTITLPSGVTADIKYMKGKHQRILTEGDNVGNNLVELLKELVVRVADVTEINDDFLGKVLLTADKEYILFMARQIAVGETVPFQFSYEYVSVLKDSKGEKRTEEIQVDLSKGIPTKKLVWEEGKVPTTYAEIAAPQVVVLPNSGLKVSFQRMNGEGETKLSKIKDGKGSSHDQLYAHFPKYHQKTEKDEVLVSMIERDLDNLTYMDIETLRKAMFDCDPKVDTEIDFEHPEASVLPPNKKIVRVSLISQKAFFFPSEAI